MSTTSLSGKRILVTGVTGMVAGPMAARLAPDNTVYGAARFAEPAIWNETISPGFFASNPFW